ncbi:DUF4817 domain-containing protein [Trichonephila clavipes]|nr:DUF4817 domain-containing protein [Trichonephila clavipes]
MNTTNIDVIDGLANGAFGKLVHVETNYEGLVKTIWIEFPDLPQIGKKLRRKAAGYVAEINPFSNCGARPPAGARSSGDITSPKSSCAAELFHSDASLKEVTDGHRTTKKTGSGRRKVTSARGDRHLLHMAVNDRTTFPLQLTSRWSTATGVLLSALSIHRRLLHRELRAREPLYRIPSHCQVIYSQFGLVIHQNDHQARRRFVEWAQNEIAVVPDFHKRILFSDEAHFWLNAYVNKQSCRIWSEANPQVYVETPLHPEKLTVWFALWAGGIIGPYFFKNDEGHNVTVNGDRYRAMITNFFIPELNNYDVQELWSQQDGATCHTSRAIIDLLKDTFGDRLISRFGPVNWPPRSCDLTPLDHFMWGYLKSLVYADKPQTLDHLEDNSRCVITDIRPQMLEKVNENWTSRLDYIHTIRGSHMPENIFKM